MRWYIMSLEEELDNLIDFGNQMLDSLAMAEKFGWDCEVLLDNIAYVAILIEEKEDELAEMNWRQYRDIPDTRKVA